MRRATEKQGRDFSAPIIYLVWLRWDTVGRHISSHLWLQPEKNNQLCPWPEGTDTSASCPYSMCTIKKYMAGLQLQQDAHGTTQEMPLASHTFSKSDTTAFSSFWFRIQPDDTHHASKTLQWPSIVSRWERTWQLGTAIDFYARQGLGIVGQMAIALLKCLLN